MAKGTRRIPLWLNILLISLAVVLVVGAVFCAAAGITAGANGTSFAEGCSSIWFSIFPGLETAETVTEEVVEATTNLI